MRSREVAVAGAAAFFLAVQSGSVLDGMFTAVVALVYAWGVSLLVTAVVAPALDVPWDSGAGIPWFWLGGMALAAFAVGMLAELALDDLPATAPLRTEELFW